MENASKALIMAGGTLVALVIISVLIIMFNKIGEINAEERDLLAVEQLEKANRQFATYNNTTGLYGSELLSLANLIVDYDNRLLYETNVNSDFYKENKVEIKVILYKDFIGYEDEYFTFGGLKRNKMYNIEKIKDYNDKLESHIEKMKKDKWDRDGVHEDTYNNMKSLLTELRSMPFVCISDETVKNEYKSKGYSGLKVTQYNNYGRISMMTFVQVYDKHIDKVNNR